VFKYRSHIIRHLRVHLDVRLHKCTIYLKQFKRNDTLKRHKLSHNTENILFKCSRCGKHFKHRNTLVQHTENK